MLGARANDAADILDTSMTPETWRTLGDTRIVRGRRLFFARAGSGEPLLLLHAYPTASWGFHRMWPALTETHDVIAPDLLGSGFSEKPRGAVYGIDHLTDLVECLLADLGVDRAHVLAHAYGVTTAQELLARSIERDARTAGFEPISMCFVNGGLFVEGTRPTTTQKLLLSPIGPLMTRFTPTPYPVFRKKLGRAFGTFRPPDEADFRAIWTLLQHEAGHRTVPYALRYLRERATRRSRWVGALESATIPMCLINGAADPVAGEDVPRIWKELLPGAPLYQLDARVGHYPPLEDPEGTTAAFIKFHREHVRPRQA